jgi:anti-anti-sigma factor
MSTTDPSKSDIQILVELDGEGVYVLRCGGNTEWRNPVDLVAAFDPVGGGKPLRGLILDLQGIQYINSAGLGAIFALRKYAAQAGGTLVVARPSATVLRLLNTINLPTLIPVTASLDEARAALNK